jgi:hypothetical protein
MDSSLHSTGLTADEFNKSIVPAYEEIEREEEEHHVHLPNPSLWPFILSAAVLLVVAGLLALPDVPWLSIVAAPFVLVGILGWALEDPMAARKEEFITVPAHPSKFGIGQEVVDGDGKWLGTIQARFDNYILVDRGSFFTKAYYVPHRLIADTNSGGVLRLTAREIDLVDQELDRVPEDLYNEVPEPGMPQLNGVPLFARRPLSPAETGHYNYGPNYPGINTDASGSYFREDVLPIPQRYVDERKKMYATSRTIPERVISSD